MSRIPEGTRSDIRWSLYITFAMMIGLVSLGFSYLSDGPVGLGVHVVAFLIPVVILVLPVIVWIHIGSKSNSPGRGKP